ncbi:MAG: hypothetical protein II821_00530, partial [Treponema sp.]|nr:hypothetical protein [Treponema sp.]
EVKETKETTSHAKTESVVKSEAKNTSESNSTPVKPIFNPEPAKKTEEKPEIETEEISINFDDDTPVTHTSRNSNVNDWFVDTKATEATGEDESLDIIDQFEQQNAEESDIFSEDSEEEPVFEAIPVTLDDIDSQNETEEIQEENIPDFTAEEPGLPEHSEQKPARNSSQITGLLLENELEPFIDEQIANGKNNLTITLIKINSLDRGNSISGKIVSLIKNHISSDNPELFEYKADSYAVVMADADLQNTVDKFEGIYNEVSDFLKDNNSVNEVSVGISSVAGRKIKAERLLLEASQALDYASSDPDSPIVAFRANPEKYREIEEA